jgi:phage baseplate assembly protein W
MATVNLNNLFKKPTNPNSAIKYIYKDFNILSMETLYSNNIGAEKIKSDLNVSYDVQAIKNSVLNILTTKKGEKILSPEFGLRIEDYLFEPVSDTIASVISNEILQALSVTEPRVQVVFVQVIPFPEQNQYTINLALRIPTLKTSFSISGSMENGELTLT